ncbi:hypothetical protein [Haloactinospora alba]|uniref:hypothetical protein n=1 Tax=Haloactinospora alba TaxID=405555 RepID=UPI001B8748AB|nr:hypothetical protein [Haloactinospora alba]
MHVTPTGSSWINQVERWFAFLATQLTRRGVRKSVAALEQDVRDWIEQSTPAPARSSGARPPRRSLTPSPDIYNEFQTQDTSHVGTFDQLIVGDLQPVAISVMVDRTRASGCPRLRRSSPNSWAKRVAAAVGIEVAEDQVKVLEAFPAYTSCVNSS